MHSQILQNTNQCLNAVKYFKNILISIKLPNNCVYKIFMCWSNSYLFCNNTFYEMADFCVSLFLKAVIMVVIRGTLYLHT